AVCDLIDIDGGLGGVVAGDCLYTMLAESEERRGDLEPLGESLDYRQGRHDLVGFVRDDRRANLVDRFCKLILGDLLPEPGVGDTTTKCVVINMRVGARQVGPTGD